MKKIKYIIYGISWLLNLLLVASVFASFNTESFRIFFNSDTLYLASIYKDLFVDGTGFSGWYLNAAPNFFPDMFLYFIINTLFSDFRTAYLVFSFIQYFLILILLNILLKTIIPKIKFEYLSFLNLIFPIFLLVTLISHNFLYTYFIFSHSFHTGMFINVLTAFIFFFKFLRTRKMLYIYLIALISFIGTYNDRLFLVMFSLPVAIVFIGNFFFINKKQLRIAGIVTIAASIVALYVFKFTKINPVFHCIGLDQKYMNFDNIIFSLKKLFTQHYNYIRDLRLQGLISIIAVFNIVMLPILAVRFYKKLKLNGNTDKEKQIEVIFLTLMFFSIVISLFSPALNGYYLGEAHLRYNIFSFYLSVFNLVFFIFIFFKGRVKNINIFSGVLFFLYIGILLKDFNNKDVFKKVQDVMQYYPEKVKQIDNFAEENNLKYGLADYWDAKYTMMFSEKNLRVYTVIDEQLNPWYHVMNKNWYFDYDKGKYNKPIFNFILLKKFDKYKIKENFGKPVDSLLFKGKTIVYKMKNIKYNRETRKPYLIN